MASKAKKPAPAKKAPAKKAAPKGAESGKRHRIDWEAIERDYRTGRFTLRELEAKHGASYAQISRKAKELTWTKDLREVIKQATDAALLRDIATKAQSDATETVLVAAEANKQVILRHRTDIMEARSVAFDLLAELRASAMLAEHQDLLAEILAGEDPTPKQDMDARRIVTRALDLGNRVGSIKALSEALTKLQAAERIAFKLDEGEDKDADKATSLTDTERAVRLAALMQKVGA
jgi:hypothetical protein